MTDAKETELHPETIYAFHVRDGEWNIPVWRPSLEKALKADPNYEPIKYTRAQPDADKQRALDPDMPPSKLLLHMGEMTAGEMRAARAAIRWANEALGGVKS